MNRKLTLLQTDDLALHTEPLEQAFTVLMPVGWTNHVHLQREHELNRIIASAISPDGGSAIYIGDPRLPLFRFPDPYLDPSMMAFTPHIRMQPFTPAEPFVQDYIRQCFGAAPGFRFLGRGPSEQLLRLTAEPILRRGHQPHATAAAITFEHRGNGTLQRCEVHAATGALPPIWFAELYLFSTTGDLDRVRSMAQRMYASRHFLPAWSAAAQQRHNHRMAMGQQQLQHIQAMTELQRQGHEQRMHDIRQMGEANTRIYHERMAQHDANFQAWQEGQARSDAAQHAWQASQAADDAMQQARINAIREEHTVVDASGTAYQVDCHHERYYVNTRDNTYIGTKATVEQQDLQRTHGVNPDDFVEVKIIR